ncbi:nuclear transport factor 2 family protein [Streptomyces sp. NPDC047974]|uniref:nuclear transport factor 2 family protein n=1 Tax=Streptomyces sp. NPDC047974 TaxID=3154343 RepID=UPI00340EA098
MTERQHPDVAEAIAGERRLHDPAVRLSRPLAEALFDPEFTEVGASGRLWTYEEMLAALPALHGGEDGPPLVADAFAGTVLAPGVVHLTYETVIDGRRARRSSLWRRDAGGALRLYYHQGTPVPGGPAQP